MIESVQMFASRCRTILQVDWIALDWYLYDHEQYEGHGLGRNVEGSGRHGSVMSLKYCVVEEK